jgi:hypothetical protein
MGPMEHETSPAPRKKTTVRHFLIAALSGGLGVFGVAADTATAQQAAAATPSASVVPLEQHAD